MLGGEAGDEGINPNPIINKLLSGAESYVTMPKGKCHRCSFDLVPLYLTACVEQSMVLTAEWDLY